MSSSSHVSATVEAIKIESPDITDISVLPLPIDAHFPYVTITEVRGEELESLNGWSRISRSLMQVCSWDRNYENADSRRQEIKNLIMGFNGNVGSTSQTVLAVNHDHDAELFDDSRELYQCISRYWIWWEEVESSAGRELPIPSSGRDLPLPLE